MHKIKQLWDEYFFSIMVCGTLSIAAIIILIFTYALPNTGYVTPHDRRKADFMEACMKVENNTDICDYEYLKTLRY